MRRITKIICVVFLISLIVVSSLSASVSQEVRKQRMKSSVALFVGYQGVVDDENSIHGVTAGFHSKFHLFRLPLFYYVEGNVGYPFAFNRVGKENGFLFTASASTGIGWKFLISEKIALSVGGGLALYNLMNVTPDQGFLYDCRFDVDILTEFIYYFGASNASLSVMFNPNITLLRLGASTNEGQEIFGGDQLLFAPQVKIGIAF